jgi:hypothetical protein
MCHMAGTGLSGINSDLAGQVSELMRSMHILLCKGGQVIVEGWPSSSTCPLGRSDGGSVLVIFPVVGRGCLYLVSILFLKAIK